MSSSKFIKRLTLLYGFPSSLIISTFLYMKEYGFDIENLFSLKYLTWLFVCLTVLGIAWGFLSYEMMQRKKIKDSFN